MFDILVLILTNYKQNFWIYLNKYQIEFWLKYGTDCSIIFGKIILILINLLHKVISLVNIYIKYIICY